MAKTFKSDVYRKNARVRPSGQNDAEGIVATITIPAGTALGIGDVLKFAILGENVRMKQFELVADAFDTNAAATLAGKLGITASDACLIATATVIQTNTTGKKNMARVDGEATAIDSFAVTPFPTQTTTQEVIFTVTAAAATAVTNVDRNITLEFEYQYAYPDNSLVGVSDPRYPFDTAGGSNTTKVYATPVIEDYNGNAP